MASKFQSKTIKEFEKKGYYVIKLTVTNKTGIADLLCLKSNEIPLFIECKEKTDTVKPLQDYRRRELIELGFKAIILQDK
jgi:Holliday junction resolvase